MWRVRGNKLVPEGQGYMVFGVFTVECGVEDKG